MQIFIIKNIFENGVCQQLPIWSALNVLKLYIITWNRYAYTLHHAVKLFSDILVVLYYMQIVLCLNFYANWAAQYLDISMIHSLILCLAEPSEGHKDNVCLIDTPWKITLYWQTALVIALWRARWKYHADTYSFHYSDTL